MPVSQNVEIKEGVGRIGGFLAVLNRRLAPRWMATLGVGITAMLLKADRFALFNEQYTFWAADYCSHVRIGTSGCFRSEYDGCGKQ